MSWWTQIIETTRRIDPSNLIADLRFPEVKAKINEIDTIFNKNFSDCDTKESYLLELRRLSQDYDLNKLDFTYRHLAKVIGCLIRYASDAQPGGTVPTLTARVSVLVNDLKYIGTVDNYINYNIITNGMELMRLKTTNASNFTTRDSELINEVWIGMKYLNNLKESEPNSPYFKYIYCAFSCGALNVQNSNAMVNLAQACCSAGRVFYSVEENVLGSVSLASYIQRNRDQPYQWNIARIYVQLLIALDEAAQLGVNNFLMKTNDIAIRYLPDGTDAPVKIIGDTFKINAYPIIVDFRQCNALPYIQNPDGSGLAFQPTQILYADISALRSIFLSELRSGDVHDFISNYPISRQPEIPSGLTIRDPKARQALFGD